MQNSCVHNYLMITCLHNCTILDLELNSNNFKLVNKLKRIKNV